MFPQTFPMIGDSLGDVFQIQAELLGLDNQLLEFRSQQTSAFGGSGRGGSGHDRADAWQDFEHPLGHELRNYFMRRVGVDFQLFAQCTDRGKGVAGPHLARNHRLLGGIDHLLIDRNTGLKCQAERNHTCTITRSTPSRKTILPAPGKSASKDL